MTKKLKGSRIRFQFCLMRAAFDLVVVWTWQCLIKRDESPILLDYQNLDIEDIIKHGFMVNIVNKKARATSIAPSSKNERALSSLFSCSFYLVRTKARWMCNLHGPCYHPVWRRRNRAHLPLHLPAQCPARTIVNNASFLFCTSCTFWIFLSVQWLDRWQPGENLNSLNDIFVLRNGALQYNTYCKHIWMIMKERPHYSGYYEFLFEFEIE